MLSASTAADLLSLLTSQAPPACLIAAITHLPLLAQLVLADSPSQDCSYKSVIQNKLID